MNQNNNWHYEMPEFAKEAFRRRDAREARKRKVRAISKITIFAAVLVISFVGIGFLTRTHESTKKPNLNIDVLSSDFVVQGKTVIDPNDESSKRTFYRIEDIKTGDTFLYCVETGMIRKVND